MKTIIGMMLLVTLVSACTPTILQSSSPVRVSLGNREPLDEVHTCLTYVNGLVTSSLDASQIKSPEDLRTHKIGGPLLAKLILIRSSLRNKTIRWNDPLQATSLLRDAEHSMFKDVNVQKDSCQTYFVGAISENVMLNSGGVKGSLYVETSKWSKDNDEIIALIFANLISNVNVIEGSR